MNGMLRRVVKMPSKKNFLILDKLRGDDKNFPTRKMLQNMNEFAEITREAVEATKHMKGMKRNAAIRKYIQLRRRGYSKEEIMKKIG